MLYSDLSAYTKQLCALVFYLYEATSQVREVAFLYLEDMMNDTNFLKAFEDAKLSAFPHQDHIRMAWLYLQKDGWEGGYAKIQSGIKHFATSLGQADKYHESITRFWALLVYHCIQARAEISDFEEFEAAYPILFDKGSIYKHYSRDYLFSAEARQNWLEPDILPMPEMQT
jgi:hypothetical protein